MNRHVNLKELASASAWPWHVSAFPFPQAFASIFHHNDSHHRDYLHLSLSVRLSCPHHHSQR